MPAGPKVFISYAREDAAAVGEIYERLKGNGFEPWLDTESLLPGEQWKPAVLAAVESADFFLACISRHSVSKSGFVQRELRQALEKWQEKADHEIYLVPVRLEDCTPPEDLKEFHWVDLYESAGWSRLLKTLSSGVARAALTTEATFTSKHSSEDMTILLETNKPVAVLKTIGYLNNQGTEGLVRQCYELLDGGFSSLVLNLRGTRIVNSLGVSIIIELIEKCLEQEAEISFCNLTPTIEKTFHISGLSQLVRIFPDQETALRSLAVAMDAKGSSLTWC